MHQLKIKQSITNRSGTLNSYFKDVSQEGFIDTEEECRAYIDGKLIGINLNPGNTPTSGSIMLGKHDGYCNGLYRNLGSYNIAFTEEQVKQINFKDESNMIKSSVKNIILIAK